MRSNFNGLDISEEQFLELPSKQQNVILYRNLKEIRNSVRIHYDKTKFQLKIQWVLIGILFVLVGTGKFLGFI